MVSVLHANLISGRVGFLLSCFYKSNFSCSGFIVARTVQSWNNIDLPDPVGKTPVTSWPFRIDSKHFTWRGLKLSDGKLPLLRENPTRWSTEKHSCQYLPSSKFCLSYANFVHPQILGVWLSCDRPMPGPFPVPPPKPGKSALGTRLKLCSWAAPLEFWFPTDLGR